MSGPPQTSPTSALPAPVREALARGATILTPHQRAARTLRALFDEDQRQSRETVWPVPEIFAFESWLGSLWTQLLLTGNEDRLLLNRSQEHQLWRSILVADRNLSGLESLDQLANLATEAWRRLALHGGRAQLHQHEPSPDTTAFARWAAEFEQTCTRRRYLPAAQLPAELIAALGEGSLDLPNGGLVLLDFGNLAAAHQELLDSIELAGYSVAKLQSSRSKITAQVHAGHDDASELRAAAQWLHENYLAAPTSRLALVVPNLDERRSAIDRELADRFGFDPFSTAEPVYEFSLGQPLSETSAGACALALLHWSLGPLPLAAVSRILLSPSLVGTDSRMIAAVAEFDAYELRDTRLLRPEISLIQCARKLEHSPRHEALQPLLLRMQAAARQLPDTRAVKSPAAWAGEFQDLLALYGWTAAMENDSAAHQLRKRWESAFDELATLDFDNTLVSARTALDRLTHIASETVFAPESHNAPLQVLGPLEVAGAPYDALWFLSADDTNWPTPTATHPLLPWSLQHAMQMPGADHQRDAAAARLLTRSLAASATQVVFSYATNGEDQLRRPSSMLSGIELEPLALRIDDREAAHALESADDSKSLPSLPQRVQHGGARILELQSACSFRAFAELRLNSTHPEDLEHGFDARQSGSVLHKVMQNLWQTLKNQDNLRALTQAQREQTLRDSIAAALDKTQQHARSNWDQAYLAIQRRRLFDLLKPWLQVELDRPAFEVIGLEEKISDVIVGPLRLNLRIDRIDETGGGRLIIDYKSGEGSYKQWQGDRPEKPQLPLYAILTEKEKLGSIAFALLRAGKHIHLQGISGSTDALPSKPMQMSMPKQLEHWKEVLERLANEFAGGTAHVDPKDYPKTCRHCTQRLLCRLDASQQFDEDPTVSDEEENVHG